MRWGVFVAIAISILVLLPDSVRGDTLHLKSGAKFEGELIEKTATHYVFKVRGIGVQRFKVGDVLRLEEKTSVYDEYAERKKARMSAWSRSSRFSSRPPMGLL